MDEFVYIRVFSYKKVLKSGTPMDIFYLDDVTKAKKCENVYEIMTGKYKGVLVPKLNKDYRKHDFIGDELAGYHTILLENVQDESLKECLCKDFHMKEYYIVTLDEELSLQETDDEKIITLYKEGVNPSIAEKLSNIFSQNEKNPLNSLTIDSKTMDAILGKTNTLLELSVKRKQPFNVFDITQKYMKLKEKITGLDDELKLLLGILQKNISLSYSSIDSEKARILKSRPLLIGATGSGKTFMIENIAKILDVPCIIEDATRYTPNAYQGESIENIFVNLYEQVDGDDERLSHSIIFLDEFDKLCKFTDEKDASLKRDVQNTLLTLMQGTTIRKKIRKGFYEETITIDTSKMTFVLSGAFEELLENPSISERDLIAYGMMNQLSGRIDTILHIPKPTKENYKESLQLSSCSYLKLLEEYLNFYQIPLKTDEAFIDLIAERAEEIDQGYRGINKAISDFLNEQLYSLYSGKMKELKLLGKDYEN